MKILFLILLLFFSFALVTEVAAADKIFSNSREVSSKSGSGKTVSAFPDVCQTPSGSPEGMGSTPYPDFAEGSDSKGDKGVKIGSASGYTNKNYMHGDGTSPSRQYNVFREKVRAYYRGKFKKD